MNVLIRLILGVLSFSILYADIDVAIKCVGKSKVLVSIRDSVKNLDMDYNFPEFDNSDDILYGGLVIPSRNIVHKIFDKSNAWDYELREPVGCKYMSSILSQRVLVENIKEFYIYLYLTSGEKYYKKYKVDRDGYQNRELDYVANWLSCSNKVDTLMTVENKTVMISKLGVYYIPKNNRHKMVIGNIEIYDIMRQEKKYYHPVFNNVPFNKDAIVTSEIKPGDYALNSIIYSNQGESLPHYYVVKNSNWDELKGLKEIINNLIQHYPNYEARNINMSRIEDLYAKYVEKEKDYKKVVDGFKMIIDTINDPHLYLRGDAPYFTNKKIINIKEVNGDIVVAGVYNDKYKDNVKNGLKVIGINGENIGVVLSDIMQGYKGKDEYKRAKAISEITRIGENESMSIEYLLGNEKMSVVIEYSDTSIIPESHRYIHGEFRMMNNISYLRLNNIFRDSYFKIINAIDKINASKGLVIDLRSNESGDIGTLKRIMSIFVKKNEPLYDVELSGKYRETILVKKNPLYEINNKIVVLVDEQTACISELMCYALKRYAGAIIVGTTSSAGAFALRRCIVLPDGTRIFNNCFYGESPAFGGRIEGIGINPDVYVAISKWSDLKPYDDKVLRRAIKCLE